LTQTCDAYALKSVKCFIKSKLRRSFLGLSPGEDGFYSSETKHRALYLRHCCSLKQEIPKGSQDVLEQTSF
jgi:hypothetical protein